MKRKGLHTITDWLAYLPELNQIPVPELFFTQICHPSGIDVGVGRGSTNAATGTHEFGLGSLKEVLELEAPSPMGSNKEYGTLSNNRLPGQCLQKYMYCVFRRAGGYPRF